MVVCDGVLMDFVSRSRLVNSCGGWWWFKEVIAGGGFRRWPEVVVGVVIEMKKGWGRVVEGGSHKLFFLTSAGLGAVGMVRVVAVGCGGGGGRMRW
ncbi:hypothetical protein HanRHA438_Chr01g0005181 [Helianthus annuus]|nr:hypothetical protein HanRHA438_Chr01g0005181 [Helianthus annuus]